MATIVAQGRLQGYDSCTEKVARLRLLHREGCKATIVAQRRLHGYDCRTGKVAWL
jgi:hypothetical protein